MKKKKIGIQSEVITAIDIGSTKICCMIGKVSTAGDKENSGIQLLGIGQYASRGLKNGQITHIDELSSSLINAVHAAEQQANKTIRNIYINLPTSSTQTHFVSTEIKISGASVTTSHLRRLIGAAKQQALSFSPQHHIIHILPVRYSIDKQQNIKDPKGMFGDLLTGHFYVITAPQAIIKNLSEAVARCHLNIVNFVVSSYASGISTLLDDESELGVTLIDIGGSTTSIASFSEGNLIHVDHIPLGGQNITNDIARILSTPISQAERLKTLYGTLIHSSTDERESIMVPQIGEQKNPYIHQVPRSLLIQIIRARMEEILDYISQKLTSNPIDPIALQRIVLTGGASQLAGLQEMASDHLKVNIRIASPQKIQGLSDDVNNPSLSSCLGIMQYGWEDQLIENSSSSRPHQETSFEGTPLWKKVYVWVKENL